MNLLAHRGRGPWARRLSAADNLKVVGCLPHLYLPAASPLTGDPPKAVVKFHYSSVLAHQGTG